MRSLGEAAPGAAARARLRRTSTTRSSRSPSASHLGAARAARGRARAARQGAGARGRPRVRRRRAARRRGSTTTAPGKHAGMLALCRAHGWPTEGYRLAGHPLQRELLASTSRRGGASTADEIPTARRRLRRRHLRAPARADGARVRAARAARRRRPRRRRDAGASRSSSAAPGATDTRAHEGAAGLDREGRRGGPALRGRRRHRRRAQGRGRQRRARSGPRSPRFLGPLGRRAAASFAVVRVAEQPRRAAWRDRLSRSRAETKSFAILS